MIAAEDPGVSTNLISMADEPLEIDRAAGLDARDADAISFGDPGRNLFDHVIGEFAHLCRPRTTEYSTSLGRAAKRSESVGSGGTAAATARRKPSRRSRGEP